ncbi:ABC transporter permease [Mycolicibacterium moriokaense]|jgi:phospholipid/cholesterol/gamma-HCH transport system permease protein|uniref:YrbE family protein n=1 Tax=Mycolicibacterium moriokaense TaxID=39691 RepID=A0AAD1HEG7_9MYCO|nr:ABC transporter permease [Mycolicibacterium moriokaense]MCV7039432.1 ABC transporter permease [Mycolicibacterium moriokaense]ORB26754.1 ABC transporter permease [Mycolicibacterium moriokaense]BBX03958.1 putative YrbE family protein [Mycolicibacterium moriokaense]
MMTASRVAAPTRSWNLAQTLIRVVREPFRTAGQWALFIGQTLWLLPWVFRRYRRQTFQVMNNLAWGRGSLIVDGGVISVLIILGLAVGASIAIEAFSTLNIIGFGALSGIVGGLANVREMAPLVAGIAFSAQAGCRMTAEIGSMRISEEIDATEAMGLRPIPFVVGTRLVGAMLCVVPGFVLTLIISFFVSDRMIRIFFNQPGGTYEHYFVQFLSPTDLAYSLLKAAVFCAAVTIIHCYYGYFASGGPVGVGQASGRAVRASLVAIMVLDFLLTVALWGLRPEFVFKG